MPPALFAIEQYDESGGAPPVAGPPPFPAQLRLACVVHLPEDDTVLALVEGGDEQTVRAALGAVGWRIDRLTTGTWITPPGATAVDRV